jgi:hypothetical protein
MIRTSLAGSGSWKNAPKVCGYGRQMPGTARFRRRPAVEKLEDRRLLAPFATVVADPTWSEQGPGPIVNASDVSANPNSSAVGAVVGLAVEPTATGGYIVYAGTANGGVWRADNITPGMISGSADPTTINWRPLSDNQPTLATSSLALDSTDPSGNTLWVGTGSLSSGGNGGGNGVGLLKTTDGGTTWQVLGFQQLSNQQIMCVLPTYHIDTGTGPGHGGQIILVASRGSSQSGIWRSADGGQTFTQVLSGQAAEIVADPLAADTYYAAVPGQGVFLSPDDGQTWTAQPRSIKFLNSNIAAMTNSGDLRIAVADLNGLTDLWVATIDGNGNLSGVFASTISASGQASFVQIGTPALGGAEFTTLTNLNSAYFSMFALTLDPNDPNIAYVSTSARLTGNATFIYRISAYNGNWATLASGTQPHPDSRSLTFLDNNTLLETDDGGIYGLSSPRFAFPSVWVSLNANLRDTEFFSVGYDSLFGRIVGGAQDTGTPQQVGQGTTEWAPVPSGGGDGGVVAVDNSNPLASNIYFYNDATLELSDHAAFPPLQGAGGVNLFANNSIFPFSGLTHGNDRTTYLTNSASQVDTSYPITLDPYTGSIPEPLLLGISGLYESFDEGAHITDVTPTGSSGNIQAIAYGARNNPSAAYVSTTTITTTNGNQTITAQMFVRTAPGAPFVPVSLQNFPTNDAINKIAIDPDDYHIAYVLDSQNQVWQFSLYTGAWTPITGNLTNVATVLVDPAQPSLGGNENLASLELFDPTPGSVPGDCIVLVGGLGGVYRRIPSGSGFTWTRFGAGMSNAVVSDLHYIPPNPNNPSRGDILLAGTFGRGAWVVDTASGSLPFPATLLIKGTSLDTYRLVLDAANRSLIDVFADNIPVPILSVPLAQINAIQVNGVQKLIVDENNGLIQIPNPTGVMGFPNCDLYVSATGTLQINDQSDQVRRVLTLGTDQITGLGLRICYANLSAVHVEGGTNSNTFTLANTDPLVLQTELDTGAGGNEVDVQQTAGSVTIACGGPDDVSVGYSNNNLDLINGTVTVSGNVPNPVRDLAILDSADSNVSSWTVSGAVPPPGGNAGTVTRTYNSSSGPDTKRVFFSNIESLFLYGGSGGATFQLGGDLGLDPLPPTVTVFGASSGPGPTGGGGGPPPVNGLILNDQSSGHSTTWRIDSTIHPNILRLYANPGPLQNVNINYQYIASLTINGGTHGNHFVLSPTADNLDPLPAITANGGGSSDTLTLDDQANTIHSNWFIAGGSVFRNHPDPKNPGKLDTANVTFSDIASLTLNGGTGGSTFLASPAVENLDELPPLLVVNGGAASDSLLLDDRQNPHPSFWSITGSSVARSYPPPPGVPTQSRLANFSKIGLLVLNGGSGGDAVRVQSTSAGAKTIFNSNGPDTVNVGGDAKALDHIQGPLTINGQGADTLDYLDQGTKAGQILSYTVSANQLSRTGSATVTYGGVATVNVSAANAAGTGFNTFYIETTAHGTTYDVTAGSSGVTEFAVSNNSSLDGIQGPLHLHGQPGPGANDFAIVSDFLNPAVHTYALSTGELQRDGMSPIFYDGLSLWEVFSGQKADPVNVLSVGVGASTIVAASGGNTVTVGTPTGGGRHTLQNILCSLLVAPTSSGGPTVLIDDSGNTSTAARTVTFDNKDTYGYRIHNLAPGDLYLRSGKGSSVTVKGNAGNETFAFQDLPPSIPMAIDGGGGTNTLDYSQYVGNVTVDLPLGIATGLTGGISNIRNVTGSQGNDLIVGDANSNVLKGGTGRNVIIGGTGPDTLDASGASSDNILIGGTTDFDTNLAALDAIFAEWTRTDLPPASSFDIRFSDLSSGKNQAHATPLNILNGTPILLTPTTVHANSSSDTLIGSNQTDPTTGNRAHNWFFFDFDVDDVIVNFLASSDRKTKVQ